MEGQTHHRGANLYEFADLLIEHGVINAVNLDGGGSSTFIHNEILVNYPSDHWYDYKLQTSIFSHSISILMLFCCSPGDPAYRCERQVSTILCFHDPQCLEPSCNDHGTCFQGECTCNSPWVGEDCGHLNCSLVNCSNHGNCTGGTATL